ncbi:hypothetical protein PCA20602_04842 [Pandoraea capi]|uniref:Uncharacterized protein n=1 Tax=Pandoraea capi TaxID=2508286 RepID=A0ABY6WBQ6_9BURK|nr:hypothetical protein [Pandoraea capi]VVE53044.1 hypothetical protein PCA20602_04842 [Pandoraea capi]
MADPRISLNKLGEYMTATPARRRRIVEDQINPKDFIAARYVDAREYISDFICGNIDEEYLTDVAKNLRSQPYDSKFVAQDKILSADAINDFLGVSDQLPTGYRFEKVAASDSSTLEVSGVTVSIRPDVYLKNDENQVVGAIKLHFPKSNPLTTVAGEYVATGLRAFVQEGRESPIDNKLCVVVDVPSASVISAPKAGKKRMSDIEAACEEINARWRAKSNPT